MLRSILSAAGRSPRMRTFVERSPMTRPVVGRFVAGSTVEDAVPVTARLVDGGGLVTLDHLGEDTTNREHAVATVRAYEQLLTRLADEGLSDRAEVSVKLSSVGQALPVDGAKIALDNARAICEAAATAGTTVTLDMEDHTTTDGTLGVLRDLRVDFPWVGAVLQAYLRRTETDCRELSTAGSRVRLCKGAYAEPESVAYQRKSEVDLSYVRCLKILMAGDGYPMVATHDPRMITVAGSLASRAGRAPDSYEFQMLYGIQTAEQHRIAEDGRRIRVYVPYGKDWYGYFTRRLAERPANVGFFVRALFHR